MSRNCPDNAVVKSSGRGPSGTSTFNVEPVFYEDTDRDGYVEVLDSLPLGALSLGGDTLTTSSGQWPLAEWRDHYPYWS